jgi:hypothetical protein
MQSSLLGSLKVWLKSRKSGLKDRTLKPAGEVARRYFIAFSLCKGCLAGHSLLYLKAVVIRRSIPKATNGTREQPHKKMDKQRVILMASLAH